MEKHEFKTSIDASAEKVWDILWSEATYPKWTAAFAEGSRAESDWNEGSKVFFLDGKGDGMVSTIAAKRPNEYMSFEHIGSMKNGVEELNSGEMKDWAGAHENYSLKNIGGKTELTVDMDIVEQYKDYFLKAWPKALEKVKELAEQN